MVKLKKRAEKFDSALLNWHYIELLVKILCIFWFIVSFYIMYCMLLPTDFTKMFTEFLGIKIWLQFYTAVKCSL